MESTVGCAKVAKASQLGKYVIHWHFTKMDLLKKVITYLVLLNVAETWKKRKKILQKYFKKYLRFVSIVISTSATISRTGMMAWYSYVCSKFSN